MRILAIRGENLASLVAGFEIDLEKPPLSSAGLFAITGATGAGKSTLLDAMCVALFDKTPRLEKSGGVPVGRADDDPKARLPSNDVRSLLRRGVGAGFAEVDYVGRDDRRYRARWSVRRANNKANGAYQKQEMSLRDLTTDLSLGRTKTEVLEKIEETIGFSYDQFRRSALLAQGDFAAFLRANSDERASLLEQMTGTELYSQLSIKAHVTHKEARARLAALEATTAAVQVLSPEARAALEAEIATLDAAWHAAAEEKATVERAARWYDALMQLRASEEQARADTEASAKAQEAEAPLREDLAQVEAAAQWRPVLLAAEQAEVAQAAAITSLSARTTEAHAAARRHAEAKAALDTAADARTRALAERAGAQLALDEAGRLDLLLEGSRARRETLIKAEELATRELTQAQRALERLRTEMADAERRAGALATWLAEHASLARLVEAWPLCQPALKRYKEASVEQTKAATARVALKIAMTQAAAEHAGAEQRLIKANEAMVAAKEAWHAADQEAQRAALTPEVHVEREQLVQRLRRAENLAPIVAQVEAQRKAAADDLAVSSAAHEKAALDAREAGACDARAALEHAAWNEAERALRLVRATLGFAERRAELLRGGEPCPLCGALDHPYAHTADPVGGLVAEAEKRVHDLGAQREALLQRAATHRANAAAEERAAAEAAQRASKAADAIADLETRWKRETAAFGADAWEPDVAGRAAVQAAVQALETRLDAIHAALSHATDRASVARSLQGAWEGCREHREAEERALDAAASLLAEAKDGLDQCDAWVMQVQRDRERAFEDLAPVFDARENWRTKLDADPEAFAATCAAEVSAFRAKTAEQTACDTSIGDLGARRAVEEAKVEERTSASAERLKDRLAEDTALAALRVERTALLDGRSTEEVRSALDTDVVQAEKRHVDAQEIEHGRARESTAAETQATAAAVALNERAIATARAGMALTEALAQAGIDLPTLRDRLAQPQTWIDTARARLAGLDKTLADGRAILGERARARAEHEGKDAPTLPEAEARARLVPADDAHNAAVEALAGARERRRGDDAAREAMAGKAVELEARRKEVEQWQAIDDLIGSVDGKKFRIFAQSLTIEALVSHANEHLNDFAPRYRLMRVPEQDLDLQVIDQDMGDEVRTVNSLSGGESFLVSLALALGLSSLAARDARVETLFIDEGFGTLDPDTLEVALAALDALQSSRRQIALISHVSGLADLIGAHVHIEKLGGGRSRIVVDGTTAPKIAVTPTKARGPGRPKKKASGTGSSPAGSIPVA